MKRLSLTRRPARRLSFVAAASALALTLTSLSGGAASATTLSKAPEAASTSQYLGWSPCCSWGTTWSYNMFNTYDLGILQNLTYLPLAAQEVPSLTKFIPILASSWSTSGQNLTVHIRPGVKWQDGQPVTSKDLYDTWVLYGTNGDYGWGDIANITTPNASTAVFTIAKGIPMALAEDNIFSGYVYPSSVYGKFVTPNLKAADIAYNNAARANPTTATKTAAYKTVNNAFLTISKAPVSISQIDGDGPYTLAAINTSEAKMVKWNGYYNAKNIHVPGIDYYDQGNTDIYPQLLSNTADFSNVFMPANIITEYLGKGGHIATPPAFGFVMAFNNAKYPLNNVKVRQALAYAIPRKTMTLAAYGSSKYAGGSYAPVPDGLPVNIQNLYLTKSQISKLNPYNTNDAKAAKLLKSAGFHKKGSRWFTAKGKPFTLTLTANSATTDIVESFTSAAKALTAFGIKSQVEATSGTIQSANLTNGNFQINMAFPGGQDPLQIFNAMLGSGLNYITLGSYAGKRGLGFGPTVNVPGLGKVNVHTITDQFNSVGPGPKMRQLTWDWARLVNQQLPYLYYATKTYQFSYSTKHFTDFPPTNAKGTSTLWNIMGNDNMETGLLLMLDRGYIRPKS